MTLAFQKLDSFHQTFTFISLSHHISSFYPVWVMLKGPLVENFWFNGLRLKVDDEKPYVTLALPAFLKLLMGIFFNFLIPYNESYFYIVSGIWMIKCLGHSNRFWCFVRFCVKLYVTLMIWELGKFSSSEVLVTDHTISNI